MTALTSDRLSGQKDGLFRTVPVAAGVVIYAGALVVMNAGGYAEPGQAGVGLVTLGRAEYQANNATGANGAVTVKVRRGIFNFVSGVAGDAITTANRGATVYVIDDETVGLTSGGGTRSVAGWVYDVDADGVWVSIQP